jgi:hypothetical protein
VRTLCLDQLVSLELTGRDVHRDVQRVPTRVPIGTLTASLLEHPTAHVDDHAGVFEDGDELVRLHNSPIGMAPAQECLDASRLSNRKVEDRLVGQGSTARH